MKRLGRWLLLFIVVSSACSDSGPTSGSPVPAGQTDVLVCPPSRVSAVVKLLDHDFNWESPRSEYGAERRLFSSGPRAPDVIGHYWIEGETGSAYALMMGRYGDWWVAQISQAAEVEATDYVAASSFEACWEIIKAKYGFEGRLAEPKPGGACALK